MICIRPVATSPLIPHEHTIIGNTVLYGATSGQLYASGQAGERLAVRNSGATAVVEGCGTNGCEYMTGGEVVILGHVGSNFGAGMTGGMAFIYDPDLRLENQINPETIGLYRIASDHWSDHLRSLVQAHHDNTGSPIASQMLINWDVAVSQFWQIVPHEVLPRLAHPVNVSGEGEAIA
jgi:glutamate synthase (NADPH/NADH) large chain